MFFEVLSLTYHSPITIESPTYGVLLGMRQYSFRRPSFVQQHEAWPYVAAIFRQDTVRRSGGTPSRTH